MEKYEENKGSEIKKYYRTDSEDSFNPYPANVENMVSS
jgi:hypothetical protein